MNVACDDGVTLELAEEAIGEGAKGKVFASTSGFHAVKLFEAPPPDRGALEETVKRLSPLRLDEYWRARLCCPDAVVTSPRLGVRMQLAGAGFRQLTWFLGVKTQATLPRAERTWLSRLRAAFSLAQCVGVLHRSGLIQGDLSRANALMRGTDGALRVIDLDGVVVPGHTTPGVAGTRDYMAPELLESGATPSMATERHSLAVLVYHLLLYRHPLKGPHQFSADPDRNEHLMLGSGGIYIGHPTDDRNRPSKGVYPAQLLGPALAALFEKAFVAGLSEPEARPTPGDFEMALLRLMDRCVPCGNDDCIECYFPARLGEALRCPWCGCRLSTRDTRLLSICEERSGGWQPHRDWWLLAVPGRQLYVHHAQHVMPGPGVAAAAAAELVLRGGEWFLLNHGASPVWDLAGGRCVLVPAGEAVRIGQGPSVRLGCRALQA